MAKQTENGKAFEYALANAYYKYLVQTGLRVHLQEDEPLIKARDFYNKMGNDEKNRFNEAAKNTINTLILLEPGISTILNAEDVLNIRIAKDSEGKAGDVRDVLFSRSIGNWEIGISAKNNHEAVKHSRLSPTIDFGSEWLGYYCSQEYWTNINNIFTGVKELRDQNPNYTWKDMGENKAIAIYRPILTAFKQEILRLASIHADVPSKLVSYLIGIYPFYKIIKDDNNNLVIIKAFNINGELNKPRGGVKPYAKTEDIKLPTRIVEFEFKEESDNTLVMILDRGWSISFRIHSASTKLETSLKFDIQLTGNPPILFTQHLFQ